MIINLKSQSSADKIYWSFILFLKIFNLFFSPRDLFCLYINAFPDIINLTETWFFYFSGSELSFSGFYINRVDSGRGKSEGCVQHIKNNLESSVVDISTDLFFYFTSA